MLRSIGKTCFAAAYTMTYAARHWSLQPGPAAAVPFIVCYHRVVENFQRSTETAIPSMLISTRMLEQHIEWIAKRFSIVSLDDVGSRLQADGSFRKPAAAITFDDGYSDVYHHAYPLLKRKGIPAAVFVVTGLVDTGRPQIFDRLYLLLRLLQTQRLPLANTISSTLKALGVNLGLSSGTSCEDEPFRLMTTLLNAMPRHLVEQMMSALELNIPFDKSMLDDLAPLTWQMIDKMHRDGITIGSHTKSHTLLTSESLETARTELTESKDTLESKLKTSVHHFAYPDGRFNSPVVEVVNSTGYKYGYGICQGGDRNLPHLTIPRKVLWERSCLNALGRFSPSIMNCQAHWVFDRKGCREHDHQESDASREQYGRIA